MAYETSYMWQLRQKVHDMCIITATVDILPINAQNQIKLVTLLTSMVGVALVGTLN